MLKIRFRPYPLLLLAALLAAPASAQTGVTTPERQFGHPIGADYVLPNCSPEIVFRAQPHGTFKLLFSGLYYGPARIRD